MALFRYISLLFIFSSPLMAEDLPQVEVQEVNNLQQDGQLAARENKPILIMFSIEGCAYCEFVREEHLKPMLRNADYRSKVIIRELHTDTTDSVIDFDGRPIDSAKLAGRYKASLNPTVVFLDSRGRELSKRLVGVSSVDYYGGFLDAAIEESRQRMQRILSAR